MDILAPERLCPVCGSPVYGRPDKIFCSEKCKNAHNNTINGIRARARRNVIAALDTNYRILEGYLGFGIKSVPMEQILEQGFDPIYSTGFRQGPSNHEEFLCYDIAYFRSVSKIFGIRRIKMN